MATVYIGYTTGINRTVPCGLAVGLQSMELCSVIGAGRCGRTTEIATRSIFGDRSCLVHSAAFC